MKIVIRAIALDIDGTITNQDRELDIEGVKAIRKAEKNHISVCLATGNVLSFARTSSILLGTSGPLIAEDGGVVYDKKDGKKYVLGNVEEVDEAIEILNNEFENIEHTDSSLTRLTGRTLERTINAQEVNRILQVNGSDVVAVDSGFAIHLKDPPVNKGEALKKVASLLECPISETAAGGDAENDVEMLRAAGWSFAPVNASPGAKEASKYVSEEPHGRGVNKAIERIIEMNLRKT